jgi:hypothetical protein
MNILHNVIEIQTVFNSLRESKKEKQSWAGKSFQGISGNHFQWNNL